MKKILIVLLAISLLLQSFSVVFSDEYAVPNDDESVAFGADKMFNTLGIIDETIFEDNVITRAEFASVVSGMLKVQGVIIPDDVEYMIADITETTKHINDIYKLISVGYMSVENIDGKYYFYPEESMYYIDAVKVMLCILGYGDYIKNFGAYPDNCIKIADEIDLILVNDDLLGVLKPNQMKNLIFRMFCTEVVHYVPDVPRGDVKSLGKTYMENYLDIYYVDGVLEATSLLDLYGREPLKLNEIRIDGVKYISNLTAENYNYLGSYIRAFVKDDKLPGTPDEIISINVFEKRNNSVLLNKPENLVNTGNFSSINVVGENRRSVKYDVDSNANIYYNFTYLGRCEAVNYSDPVVTELFSKFGSYGSFEISMNDGDGDGLYDFVWVRDFTDVILKSFNYDMVKLTTSDNENYEMKTAFNNYAFVTLDDNSEIFNLKDFSKNCVVSIIYDGVDKDDITRAVMYVSKRNVAGTITEINNNSATVNSNEYRVSKEYQDKVISDPKNNPSLKVGMEATLLLSCFGEICGVDNNSLLVGNEQFGFLTRVTKGEGIADEVFAELYTSGGDKVVYAFADKCQLNGTKVSVSNMFKLLYDDYKKDFENSKLITIYSLIKYVVVDNKITKLEIAVQNEESDRLYPEITMKASECSQVDMVYKYQTFGKRVGVSDSTVIFSVPTLVTFNDSLDDINAVQVNPTFNADCAMGYEGMRSQSAAAALDLQMEFYELDNTHYAGAAVRYYKYVGSAASGSSNLPLPSASTGSAFLISKVYRGLNENGEEVFVFEGFDGYVKKTLHSVPLKSEYATNPWTQFPLVCTYDFQREYPRLEIFKLTDLRAGDMVKFYLTAKNEVLNIYPMARGGKVEERAWIANSYGNVMYGVNFGEVVAFENGRVLLREIDGVLRVHNIGSNAEIVKYNRTLEKAFLSNTTEIEVGMDLFLSSYYTGIRSMAYFED